MCALCKLALFVLLSLISKCFIVTEFGHLGPVS